MKLKKYMTIFLHPHLPHFTTPLPNLDPKFTRNLSTATNKNQVKYLRYRPGLATKTQTRSRQPHQTVTRGFLHFAIDNCETFHYPFTGRRENRNNTVAER